MSTTTPAGPSGTRVEHLLVVDDDAGVCALYKEVFRRAHREVVVAGSVAQAMQQMDALEGDAGVLVVDLSLPDGDGTEFVRAASQKYGPRPTLYLSGWTHEFWNLHDAPGRWLVMRKPVPIAKLKLAVEWLASGGPKPAELDAPD